MTNNNHQAKLIITKHQFEQSLESLTKRGQVIQIDWAVASLDKDIVQAEDQMDRWADTVYEFLLSSFTNDRKAKEFKSKRAENKTGIIQIGPARAAQLRDIKQDTLRVKLSYLEALAAQIQYFGSITKRKSMIGFVKKPRFALLFFILACAFWVISFVRSAPNAPSPIEWIENDNLTENVVSVHLAPALKRKNEGTASFLDSKKLVHFQSVQYTIKKRQIHARITWELWYSEKDENNPSPLTGYTDLISKVIPGDTKIELLYEDLPLESGDFKIMTRRAAFKKSNKPYQDVEMADSWKSDEWKSVVGEEKYRKINSTGFHSLVKLWDWRGEYNANKNSWLAQVTLQPLEYQTTKQSNENGDTSFSENDKLLIASMIALICALIGAAAQIIAALIARGKKEANSN